MRTMLTLAWWCLPTLFIATYLRSWSLPTWTRWSSASAIWLVGSGVYTWATMHALGARAFSPWVSVVPVIALSLLGYWVLRVTRFKQTYAEMGLDDNGRSDDVSGGWLNAVALVIVALLALFFLSAHFTGSIATRGASSEYLATSTIVRIWMAERLMSPLAISAALNDSSLPFFGWVQLGGARAALGWEEATDTLMRGLLLVVIFAFVLERLLEGGVSTIGAIAVCGAIALSPGFLGLLTRHSAPAIVTLLTVASIAAWIGHPRPHVALLFAAVALLWSAFFGWPIALATALTLGFRGLKSKNGEKWLLSTFGAVLVLLMIVLQREVFLPKVMLAFFQPPDRPLLDWEILSTGGAVLLIAIGLLSVTILRRRYETALSRQTQWMVALFVAFTLISLLRARSGYLAATDAVRINLFLAALSPPLLLWLAARALTTVHRLSDYAGFAAASTLGESAVPSGTTQIATAGIPTGQLDDAPEITLDDLRDRLMAGYAALEGGDLRTASAQAEDVLAYDPQFPDAHHLLGFVALRENRPGDALRAVLKALDVFPEHALFHLTVSDIYGMQGRFSEQAFALAEASRLDPSNMAIKTKLLLAKRKSLMAQAAKAESGPGDDAARSAYEILVRRQQSPRV